MPFGRKEEKKWNPLGWPNTLSYPLHWKMTRVIRVSDIFREGVPDDFLDCVFGVMWACMYGGDGKRWHTFVLCTEYPERAREYLSQDRREQWARAAVLFGGGIDPDGIYNQTLGATDPHHVFGLPFLLRTRSKQKSAYRCCFKSRLRRI